MQKLLTIVVPVYNTEKYLPKCLDSLIVPEYLNQLEVLVIIDGSPDNSAAVAKQYQQQYPSTFIVIEKENGGHGSTINKGLSLATGKYFRVLDSDDWFDEANFKLFLDRLSTADEDIVMTHVVREYPSENLILDFKPKGINIPYDQKDIDLKLLEQLPPDFFLMCRCTYNTKCLRRFPISLLEHQSFEDTFLHIAPMLFLHSLVYYDLVIYHYLLDRPEQSSRLNYDIQYWQYWIAVVEQMLAWYTKYHKQITGYQAIYALHCIRHYINHMYLLSHNLPYNDAKQVLKTFQKGLRKHKLYDLIKSKHGSCYEFMPYWCYRKGYSLYKRLNM